MKTDETRLEELLRTLWRYYDKHARSDLPWRLPELDGSFNAYKILLSELMLQQTQVARVVPKYEAFLARFPTIESLAAAELGEVLKAWQGLGYNRRAKYLWLAAKYIVENGWPDDLTKLPGIGTNTAGAIRAYAFNEPAIFVETNIRTVYIHHFSPNEQGVSDAYIGDLLAQTLRVVTGQGKRAAGQNVNHLPALVRKNVVLSHEPRDFYWALMDYGTFLKTEVRNISQSKHYRRQPIFQGSKRQLRGLVIRALSKSPHTLPALRVQTADDRLEDVVAELTREGLITKQDRTYRLAP